ncbi:ATP-binding cassette domain-containing protein [Micromonospora chalcea]|uniref:ABC transporter ATP-binding protein n=1 Tax=Micromonospora chalcea TaxID=1874 RepID=UPI0033F33718
MTGDHLAIEASGLTKRYGDVTAVRDLTFTVRPGAVTGFLGPNGAGKTTTMRMLTGLVTPTSGTATIGGQPYGRLAQPARTVGAVFDGNAFHPGHTARDHLGVYAAMAGCPDSRVAELLDLLGLAQAADRRTRGFSTGMRQRLSLATALLGDPRVLLLDEPSNGLDPEGMSWLRGLLRRLADEGRTVLVSSHVLHEVQQVVDDVVVIRRGELVAAGPLSRLTGPPTVLVTSPDATALAAALAAAAGSVEAAGPGRLRVRGLDAPRVADLAADHRLRVHELVIETTSLEQLFLDLTTEKAEAR